MVGLSYPGSDKQWDRLKNGAVWNGEVFPLVKIGKDVNKQVITASSNQQLKIPEKLNSKFTATENIPQNVGQNKNYS